MPSPYVPPNTLQNVSTFQTEIIKQEIAMLRNSYVAIGELANMKFKNFNDFTAQLGDKVTFDLSPRSTVTYGLTGPAEAEQQRIRNIICCQAAASKSTYNEQQWIFNMEANDYIAKFGRGRVMELATSIEEDLLKNFVSNSTVLDPNRNASPLPGSVVDHESGPYRFYGNGIDVIPDSYQVLAQAKADFMAFGASNYMFRGVVPNTAVPKIVAQGLTQFATNRNNEDAKSWELPEFSNTRWFESNLLPTHYAGSVGNAATIGGKQLTLVIIDDPSGNNITQLTFSGATPNDLNAIKSGDMFQFIATSGHATPRFRTFVGHVQSSVSVQCRVIGDSAADGAGNVTVKILPKLQWTAGKDQNLTTPLTSGMKVQFVPSHRAGCLMSGDPFLVAMPKLSNLNPFDTNSVSDPDSGASLRHYFGTDLSTMTKIYGYDVIWGSHLINDNCMRLIYPLNAGY